MLFSFKQISKEINGKWKNISDLIENAERFIWSIDNKLKYITFNKLFQYFVHNLRTKISEIGKSVMAIQFDSELSDEFKENYIKVVKLETVRNIKLI